MPKPESQGQSQIIYLNLTSYLFFHFMILLKRDVSQIEKTHTRMVHISCREKSKWLLYSCCCCCRSGTKKSCAMLWAKRKREWREKKTFLLFGLKFIKKSTQTERKCRWRCRWDGCSFFWEHTQYDHSFRLKIARRGAKVEKGFCRAFCVLIFIFF